MDGEALFSTGQSRTGRGKAKSLWSGAGKGSKSAGQGGAGKGNILRITADF